MYMKHGCFNYVVVFLETTKKKLFILIDGEAFPVWGYAAVAGGVLLIVLIVAVVAVCRARKTWKKAGKKRNETRDNATEEECSVAFMSLVTL